MKLKVTQEHIDNGKAGCFICPIAIAGREQIEGVGIVEVGSLSLFTYHEESDEQERGLIEYKLPKEAQQFIRKFDDSHYRGHTSNLELEAFDNTGMKIYERPEPFEFELGVGK